MFLDLIDYFLDFRIGARAVHVLLGLLNRGAGLVIFGTTHLLQKVPPHPERRLSFGLGRRLLLPERFDLLWVRGIRQSHAVLLLLKPNLLQPFVNQLTPEGARAGQVNEQVAWFLVPVGPVPLGRDIVVAAEGMVGIEPALGHVHGAIAPLLLLDEELQRGLFIVSQIHLGFEGRVRQTCRHEVQGPFAHAEEEDAVVEPAEIVRRHKIDVGPLGIGWQKGFQWHLGIGDDHIRIVPEQPLETLRRRLGQLLDQLLDEQRLLVP